MADLFDPAEVQRPPHRERRGRRVAADLWVRIGGLEGALRRRRGDLCATGLYVSLHDAVGCPGDVMLLTMVSLDRKRRVQTLAKLARIIRQDDRARGARVIGAAFEFLPQGKLQPEIVELLKHTVEQELVLLKQELEAMAAEQLLPQQLEAQRGAELDLTGQIRHLEMERVLRLLESECYSGVLSAATPHACLSLEVQNGQIVSSESTAARGAESALEQLLALTDGEFKFRSRRPPNLDGLAGSTARLLKDVLAVSHAPGHRSNVD